MQRKNKNDCCARYEKLAAIKSEILYRNDKLDELIRDIADEVKILRQLLVEEGELRQ